MRSIGIDRVQQLLADLLSYSRISTRGKPFRPVNVGKVLQLSTPTTIR